MLAASYLAVVRALLVPSPSPRTFVLSLLAVSALPLIRWIDPIDHGVFSTSRTGTWLVAIDVAIWSAVATVVATVASSVIYGLRRRVHEAQQLGQYTLERKIGQGGMGQVFRASHALLRRPTAIKLLVGEAVSEEQVLRFEREVQITSRLTHPNTVAVYDYGRTPDGVFYYAMEYLEGFDLETVVRMTGAMPAGRVIHVLEQVCGSLSEAHELGLIHRDVKPANILLCQRGGIADFVKVLDFGLVKEIRTSDAVARSLTGQNIIVGTPLYLAPEAIVDPHHLDPRADLYGVGAVAYFLLTGVPVFNGASIVEVCSHHLQTPPEPPSRRNPAVPKDLEALVLACLAKAPDERPQTADELRRRLAACVDAGTWTNDAAQAWWVEHGRASSSDVVHESSSDRTVTVDLRYRARDGSRSDRFASG
jgi:serine/threonine-protein kinase